MIQKRHGEFFSFILSNFDKQEKTQRLTKFKKKSVNGVQSHLKVLKIYSASEPYMQNFF